MNAREEFIGEDTEIDGERTGAENLAEQIKAAFENASNESRVTVVAYKKLKNDGKKGVKPARLFEVDQDDADTVYDRLLREFGSGDYMVDIRINGRVNSREDFTLLRPTEEATSSPAAAQQSNSETAQVLKLFIETSERNHAAMMAMMERITAAPPATQAQDPLVMVERIVNITHKLAPPPPEHSSVVSGMEMFLKGAEFVKDAGGGGESGMVDLLRDVLKSPAVEAAIQHGISKMAETKKPAAATSNIAAPAAPPADQTAFIRSQLERLVKRAEAGSEPELWANAMDDEWPAGMSKQIVETPDVLNRLAILDPRVNKHREWFESLLAELNVIVHGEPEGQTKGNAA